MAEWQRNGWKLALGIVFDRLDSSLLSNHTKDLTSCLEIELSKVRRSVIMRQSALRLRRDSMFSFQVE